MRKRLLGTVAGLGLGLTALSAATLTGFAPAQGGPGTQVTIQGTGLGTATEVRFGTNADFTILDNNRILAVVPLEGTTGRLQVKIPPNTMLNSSSDFMVAPRVTQVSPERGATNTTVLIYGANLLSVTNVQIAGWPASFSPSSAMQITATVPAEATNGLVGPIQVTSPAGTAISTNEFLVMGRAPYVDVLSQDIAAPGMIIQLWGANFVGTTAVTFSNLAARFTVSSASQLNVTVPTNPVPTTPLTNLIRVVNAGGTGVCSTPFRVTRAPVITNVLPEFSAPGRSVTLEGFNLANVTGLGFGGVRATDTNLSASQIVVTVPDNATNGPITATNAYGVGTRTYVLTRAPILDHYFEPPEGSAGRNVAIWGANLLDTRAVLFNGSNATSFRAASDIQVNAVVPVGATSGPITVTNNYGSAATTNDFIVTGSVSLPVVTAITPSGGPRGLAVMINGSNFTDPVTVRFNGVVAPDAVATSRSQVNATVPPGAFTGPVTVVTSAGTSTVTQVFYASPRLTTFAPTNGIAGDSVVLTGTNFTGALAVSFDGHDAGFTVNDTNRITAIVPPDATSGPIQVLAPGGAFLGTDSFRALPHIASFAPSWGPPGTRVGIHGSSLQEASRVDFAGTPASFTNATATELQATVPENARTGFIEVTTPDGKAVSSNQFTVTGSTDLRLRFDMWADMVTPGDPVSYRVQASNLGSLAASQVRLVYRLPAGMVFESAQADRGTWTFTNQVVTCDVELLLPLEEVTLTVAGTYLEEGIFSNTTTVTAAEADPNPSNNTDSVGTTVVSDASRTLAVEAVGAGAQVRVSWPTSAVPFTLQAKPNLSSADVWLPVTNAPSVEGGHNLVTNSATNTSRFYRLRGP